MADVSGSPASGVASHPSSPETYSDDALSSNASPISAPPSLHMASTPSDREGESSSTQGPSASLADSTRPPADVARSLSSAGKGGCWTCRLRRKKCDEEQEHDGGPCKTCRRLRIECLGWGAKRPEWMRDKEKAAAYKAQIKDQLTKAGLIRGQPRPSYHQPPPIGSLAHPHSHPHLHHGHSHAHHMQAVAGPGPSSLSRRQLEGRYDPVGYVPSRNRQHPSGSMSSVSVPGGPLSARSSPTDFAYHSHTPTMPVLPPMDVPYHTPSQTPFSYSASLSPTLPIPTSDETLTHEPYMPPSSDLPQIMAMSSISHQDYIGYYFETVRKVQYVLAGNSLTNTLYTIVVDEPNGAVANAICALSSLHYSRSRGQRQLLEQPTTTNYYNRARDLLLSNRSYGQYHESDAVAAIQLIHSSQPSGVWMDWSQEIDIACDWLSQTRIHEEQNPKLTLMNLTPAGRFAAKATMWIDVLSSITLMERPRFLALYRRLFSGGAGFWASTQQVQVDLRMDTLTGCPDEAMLAIAEVSDLAYWKATELQKGSLSVRELIRRGDIVEQQLRQRSTPRQPRDGNITPLDQSLADSMLEHHLPVVGGMPIAGPASAVVSNDEARSIIADIFRETAVLYLHSVLSDALPGVPEVHSAVSKIFQLLHQLPPSDFDRALLLPLYLVGCMSDDRTRRDLVRQRLRLLNDSLGNIGQFVDILESAWNRRDATLSQHGMNHVVYWRENLRSQWFSLLLL